MCREINQVWLLASPPNQQQTRQLRNQALPSCILCATVAFLPLSITSTSLYSHLPPPIIGSMPTSKSKLELTKRSMLCKQVNYHQPSP
jgi:hypothetical protein